MDALAVRAQIEMRKGTLESGEEGRGQVPTENHIPPLRKTHNALCLRESCLWALGFVGRFPRSPHLTQEVLRRTWRQVRQDSGKHKQASTVRAISIVLNHTARNLSSDEVHTDWVPLRLPLGHTPPTNIK